MRGKERAEAIASAKDSGPAHRTARPAVYGDAAYGTGAFLDHLRNAHIASFCKTQPPVAPAGHFSKQAFSIDLEREEVTCPASRTVAIRRDKDGDGVARFGSACASCPLASSCTSAASGRSIQVGRYEHRLSEARAEQEDLTWSDEYRATRPKVERKLGHLMRRKHGGRRARVRGQAKVDADFNLLAGAQNLARLATLGLGSEQGGWAVAGT